MGYNDELSLSLSICWLYTLESWVYKTMNESLRNDSSLMEKMASYINGLMQSYRYVGSSYYYSGTVYRRSKLSEKDLSFYTPGKYFCWSAFTSTTVQFTPTELFGDVLFIIMIPDDKKQYALNLENISDFPEEREVLLLPNIGFKVYSISNGNEIYSNVKIIISLSVEYVCIS